MLDFFASLRKKQPDSAWENQPFLYLIATATVGLPFSYILINPRSPLFGKFVLLNLFVSQRSLNSFIRFTFRISIASSLDEKINPDFYRKFTPDEI